MEPSGSITAGSAPAAARRALVVEDEIIIRLDVCEELRNEGWEVVETSSADEALEVLGRDRSFGLLLTDVHMPGENSGIDLARHVRESCPGIKIVVMSGQYQPDHGEQRLVDLFVRKPVWNIVHALSPLTKNTYDADAAD